MCIQKYDKNHVFYWTYIIILNMKAFYIWEN